ncbi:MAG TPA: DegT/DnrJ/EryC1/StrS family aminotransferase [Anaerolineae bacterium]|nr:DegT/DnrJ/EryC1/StrS family aminotransferase [Anaerolineae bacterium]
MIPIAKPVIQQEEKQAVSEVLDSGILAQGPRTRAFEEAFASMCDVRHAIATSSGTTALHIALLVHGIGPGDEVITTPFTFIASANSILFVGAKPVFVDINARTYNIDPGLIEDAITSRTKAILPVHLYGLCCDMNPILDIAKRHDLIVIEDACQSHGAEYQGKKAGSFGIGAFSFYPTKNITCGEGGMITTSDGQIAERCRIIRNHGMHKRYFHEELGYNFRMTDIHAAIGLEQLKKLDKFNRIRRENAAYYSANIKGVLLPFEPKGYKHVYHQYTIRVPDGRRDVLRDYLKERSIGSEIYYPVPIHQQSFYKQKLEDDLHFPQTEKAAKEVLSIPVHPSLSQADKELVFKTINDFMEQGSD